MSPLPCQCKELACSFDNSSQTLLFRYALHEVYQFLGGNTSLSTFRSSATRRFTNHITGLEARFAGEGAYGVGETTGQPISLCGTLQR